MVGVPDLRDVGRSARSSSGLVGRRDAPDHSEKRLYLPRHRMALAAVGARLVQLAPHLGRGAGERIHVGHLLDCSRGLGGGHPLERDLWVVVHGVWPELLCAPRIARGPPALLRRRRSGQEWPPRWGSAGAYILPAIARGVRQRRYAGSLRCVRGPQVLSRLVCRGRGVPLGPAWAFGPREVEVSVLRGAPQPCVRSRWPLEGDAQRQRRCCRWSSRRRRC
mmetsp:Transcript_49447/g.142200  ORF Transcript_49447/g.142200 Transcript_49447/m.142200 type:complete len:221 (-) Transcript_49447:2607-3269(-)